MYKTIPFVLLAFISNFWQGCKSGAKTIASAPRPAESYAPEQAEQPLVSSLAIPVSIPIDEVLRKLNTTLSQIALYEDYSYDDNGRDDLMMNAWLSQNITANLSSNTIKYRVPLKLWLKKRLLVGEAEATGELALSFRTTYSINPDWTLTTQTIVEYHEWLSKPVLKTGLGDISVETIANLALSRSKKTLAESLDKTVGEQMSLRPYVESMWTALQTPSMLSEEYKMWIKTTPTSIAMTPIRTWNNTIQSTIAVNCINEVTFGAQPFFRANSLLPNLVVQEQVKDEFQMQFATDVPFGEAERLARQMMVGQVFESGKNKVQIQDIQIWGNNDRLIVNSKLTGSFNGDIFFTGRPKFNPTKNAIEVADLDFHVDTRNFLYRSAAWLFQGPIKRKMAAAMVFPLEENLNTMKTSVQETLNRYEIQPGIILSGTLDSVKVNDTRLTPAGIRVDIFSKGKVNLDVKGL
jgi:Domain of unknown function (DUF4403)